MPNSIRTQNAHIPDNGVPTPRVHSWRAKSSRRRWQPIAASFAILAACSLLVVFVVARPFRRENQVLLLLAPQSLRAKEDSTAQALDVARNWAQKQAQIISDLVTEPDFPLPAILASTSFQEQSLSSILSRVQTHSNSQSSVCVYLSGVVSLNASQATVCDSSLEATRKNCGVNVVELIRELQRLRCHRGVLIIDAIAPLADGAHDVAIAPVFDQIHESIEAQLLTDNATPLVVYLNVSTAQEMLTRESIPQGAAQVIKDWIKCESHLGVDSLFPLLDQEITRSRRADTSSNYAGIADRMLSPNWTIESHLWQPEHASAVTQSKAPIARKVPASNASVQASQTVSAFATTSTKREAAPIEPSDQLLSGIAQASGRDCLDLIRSMLQRWHTSPRSVTHVSLAIPAPASRFQRYAVSARACERWLVRQEAGARIDESSIDTQTGRAVARRLLQIELGTNIEQAAGTLPDWLDHLRPIEPIAVTRRPNSLITATLMEALGWAEPHSLASKEDVELLNRLIAILEDNATQDDSIKMLESVSPNNARWIEVSQLRWLLSKSSLPWSIRQRLAFSYLLGNRLAADPVARSWAVSQLEQADRHWLNAIHFLSDRPSHSWCATIEEELALAQSHYLEGIRICTGIREAESLVQESVQEILRSRPWRRQSRAQDIHEDPTVRLLVCLRDLNNSLLRQEVSAIEQIRLRTTEGRAAFAHWLRNTSQNPDSAPIPGASLATWTRPAISISTQHREKYDVRNSAIISIEQFGTAWQIACDPSSIDLADRLEQAKVHAILELAEGGHDLQHCLDVVASFRSTSDRLTEELRHRIQSDSPSYSPNSLAWILLLELSEAKTSSLFPSESATQRLWLPMVEFNIARLERFSRNATQEELEQFQLADLGWRGSVANHDQSLRPTTDESLAVEVPTQIDLKTTGKQRLELTLRSSRPQARVVNLTIQFPEDQLLVQSQANDRPSTSNSRITYTLEAKDQLVVPFLVSRREFLGASRPIVFSVESDGTSTRHIVEVLAPGEQIATSQWITSAPVPSSLPLPNQETRCIPTICNRENPLTLTLTGEQNTIGNVLLRVLAIPGPRDDLPIGTLNQEEANHFLNQIGKHSVMAGPIQVQVSPRSATAISLPPMPMPPDAPTIEAPCLLVELKSPDTGLVEFEQHEIVPVRPSKFVSPKVEVDPVRQTVVFNARLLPSIPLSPAGISIDLELREWPSRKLLASTRTSLGTSLQDARTELSTVRCEMPEAVLLVHVNEWPNAFVYKFRTNVGGSVAISPTTLLTDVQIAAEDSLVSPTRNTVRAKVDTWVSESMWRSSHDSLVVGLDFNQNRFIDESVYLQLATPHQTRVTWRGVNEQGQLMIYPSVSRPQLDVPLGNAMRESSAVIAEVTQSSNKIWSVPASVTIDDQAPIIESVRINGTQPHPLGQPVAVLVQVNDFGLSGAGSVVGAWSTSGETRIKPEMKPIPAVVRDRDQWWLNLPTTNLPSGNSLLVIQAQDRVGNLSEPYLVTIELLTPEEIALRSSSIKTFVRGQVRFGSAPISGLDVRLLSSSAKPLEPGNVTTVKSDVAANTRNEQNTDHSNRQTIATAKTDTQGNFVLTEVPSGTYLLEIRGIARGMKTARSQVIQVAAPQSPPPIHVRLDKPTTESPTK